MQRFRDFLQGICAGARFSAAFRHTLAPGTSVGFRASGSGQTEFEVDDLDAGSDDVSYFKREGDHVFVGKATIEGRNGRHVTIAVEGTPLGGEILPNVTEVVLSPGTGIYRYAVWVYGGGPKGHHPSWRVLEFTDESGDTYSLGLYNSSRKWHSVRYNSPKPAIVRFSWREANAYLGQ